MILTVTGHRSEDATEPNVRGVFRKTLESHRDDVLCCGLANGVDLWAADEAINLGIEVWAFKPWRGHQPRKQDAELYARVLAAASRVVVVVEQDDYPGPWVYQKRNEAMVDASDYVLAYWNGKKKGGTFNCITYAKSVEVHGRNLYNDPPF